MISCNFHAKLINSSFISNILVLSISWVLMLYFLVNLGHYIYRYSLSWYIWFICSLAISNAATDWFFRTFCWCWGNSKIRYDKFERIFPDGDYGFLYGHSELVTSISPINLNWFLPLLSLGITILLLFLMGRKLALSGLYKGRLSDGRWVRIIGKKSEQSLWQIACLKNS